MVMSVGYVRRVGDGCPAETITRALVVGMVSAPSAASATEQATLGHAIMTRPEKLAEIQWLGSALGIQRNTANAIVSRPESILGLRREKHATCSISPSSAGIFYAHLAAPGVERNESSMHTIPITNARYLWSGYAHSATVKNIARRSFASVWVIGFRRVKP